MLTLLRKAAGILRNRYNHRLLLARQRRSTKHIPMIPEPPAWQFPAGFTVRDVGETGVRIVDNFCTAEESAALIEMGRGLVAPSTVIGPGGKSILHDYRTSSDSFIPLGSADPLILNIVYRAASLLGLPMSHSEKFSLTRYRSGEYYKAHLDHDGTLKADRLYTVLLYLNDLSVEEGGGTLFEKLNLATQPVQGRAVLWVNSDREKRALKQTLHSSLPVTRDGAEKWVAQMWFRNYVVNTKIKPPERADVALGTPLTEAVDLPTGLFVRKGK
jgi:hypothetical protein